MIPRQALALQAIDREFSNLANPCFAVIRVLLQNDDRRVLIMNRDPGTELLHYLNTTALPTGAAARKDLPSYSRMAGEWLRLFHDRVPLEPGVRVYNQASELLEQATSWLGTLEMVDHVWRARVENRIAECAGKLNGLPRTTLHGDYWPGNILANNGRIAIIDVLGWAEGPCWLDIAYFLLHLRATDKQVWLQMVSKGRDLAGIEWTSTRQKTGHVRLEQPLLPDADELDPRHEPLLEPAAGITGRTRFGQADSGE